ncbi:MAG: MBL fold metallo-hydrolase [Bdellovibrionales bacterium]|nr:MBL fold metallo-hydrolase [Bdellovibrionales bacterium]
MKKVQTFFDKDTWTLTYVVYDLETKDAIVIDPVLNYEPNGSTYWYDAVEEVLSFISKEGLHLHYSIDTHAHADHITGTEEIKNRLPHVQSVIGKSITIVQDVFKGVFHLADLKTDASQFDVLLEDGQTLQAGSITMKAIHTPGHTPTCTSYLIDDMVFTGDALFMPDFGTGRCDFPKGSASDLYTSVHEKLYQLPDTTRVFVGHDYQPGGRKLQWETTIGDSKKNNIHLKASTSKEEFITFRQERDKTLSAPRLLLPSIQVNINAGKHPSKESNGMMYLKMPFRKK